MMTSTDVDNCSFSAWYPSFEKVTFKSVVLPLPQDVVAYLSPEEDNGLFLPVECDSDNPEEDSDEEDQQETCSNR